MKHLNLVEFVNVDLKEMDSWLFEYSCRYLSRKRLPHTEDNLNRAIEKKYSQIEKTCIELSSEYKYMIKLELFWDKINSAVSEDLTNETQKKYLPEAF
jgi:hypothetical protein